MSFDETGTQISEEPNITDSQSNLFKIDMPIGKLKFFVNSIILFAIQMIAMAIYFPFYFKIKEPSGFIALLAIFIILFGIPLLYLNFVNYTKRMWDISGKLHTGIWLTAGLFAISSICVFLFPIAILFFYIAMIFLPGEIVKKTEE